MAGAGDGPTMVSTPSALRRAESLPEPTLEDIMSILFQATSPFPNSVTRATDMLSDLETQPSLWLRLLDVAFTSSCPLNATMLTQEQGRTATAQDVERRWSAMRTMAVIRFKNMIDKYWRSRVVNRVTITIPQATKEQLRQSLFRSLDERDRGVALQASVSIARIARIDFPNAWPSLFNDLQSAMVQAHANIVAGRDVENNRLVLLRSADVCARTLKELGAVRILAGKIRMTELAQQLLPTFVPMFQQYFAESMPPTDGTPLDHTMPSWSQSPLLASRIRTCHLLLKSVSHLAVADSGTLTRNVQAEGGARTNFAREFFRVTPSLLQHLRDTRWAFIRFVTTSSVADDESTLSALQKHLVGFGKFYVGLATRDRSKAVAWEGWDEVVMWYWQQAVEASSEELSRSGDRQNFVQLHPPKLIVQAIAIMQHSLQEWNKANALPQLFRHENNVSGMVDVCVKKLMLLTQEDLEKWQEDPEDWSVAEEAETYDVEVRPAAERLLLVLSNSAPARQSKFVGERLWEMFEALGRSNDASIGAVLHRDALYAGLGRCCDQIVDEDERLSSAIVNHLVPQASFEYPADASWVLIRRRVAWLIWEWSEHIVVAHRPIVYRFLVDMLQDVPGKTDAAVRLAAARSLAALADSVEFDSDAFQPFIDASLSRLATLAAGAELHEMDSIKTCTNTMSILIERLGARIAPHLDQLATLVPHLWTMDDPECKARPSIIVFVGRLVRSVELIPHSSQGAGSSLHGIVEVIVRDSLTPQNSPLLGKDALELWIRTLRSSSQMTDPLFRLLNILPDLLDQPDFCPEACRVAQESTMMAAKEVIATYGTVFFQSFAKVVGDPRSPLILHPISALDVIVQALHAQGVDRMAWATLLDHTTLFTVLLGSLLKIEDSANVTAYFVALLARFAYVLNGTSIFLELVRSSAFRLEGDNCDVNLSILLPMAKMWCTRVENMASARKRKITCLGLAALLASANAEREERLYDLLPDFVGVWMDFLGDVRQDTGPSEDVGAPPVPNAPPSSPLLQRSLSAQAPEIFRNSPSPALSIPGLEGIDDADDWIQETSPGKARLTELNRLDPVNTVTLASFIGASLRQAHAQGGPAFQRSWSSMDGLVLELFQKEIE